MNLDLFGWSGRTSQGCSLAQAAETLERYSLSWTESGTVERGRWYAILPMLPELSGPERPTRVLTREYSSMHDVMPLEETAELLEERGLMPEETSAFQGVELLR